MEKCLDHVFDNTSHPFEVWVLSGGTPEAAKRRWEERYAGRVQFTFLPEFRNGADLRNFALSKLTSRLAVFLDNDVYVRPDWLGRLVQCQRERAPRSSHLSFSIAMTASTPQPTPCLSRRGTANRSAAWSCATKTTKWRDQPILFARKTSTAKIHCLLVLVEVGKRIQIFDPNLREFRGNRCRPDPPQTRLQDDVRTELCRLSLL